MVTYIGHIYMYIYMYVQYVHTTVSYHIRMNHNSGLIVRNTLVFHENSNRMHT